MAAAPPAATGGAGERSSAALVAAADAALYEAKTSGSGNPGEDHDVPGLRLVSGIPAGGEGNGAGETAFDVLSGLVTAIDNKDHYTRRHSELSATKASVFRGIFDLRGFVR